MAVQGSDSGSLSCRPRSSVSRGLGKGSRVGQGQSWLPEEPLGAVPKSPVPLAQGDVLRTHIWVLEKECSGSRSWPLEG